MGKSIVKPKKLVGQKRKSVPTRNKAKGTRFQEKDLGEVGSLTSGEVFNFMQTREDEWLVLGENIDTGRVLREEYFYDEGKAKKAWEKTSLSFHKRELKRMRKRRKTLSKRYVRTSDKRKRAKIDKESKKLYGHIVWAKAEIERLEEANK